MQFHRVRADGDVALHVGESGEGQDVLVLSGGPGCVHYLADDSIVARGVRTWFPEPRGVGRSEGSPHTMAEAVADLESVRTAVGVESWVVLGHSWGSDLAVRYALDHPESVSRVVGIAGHGLRKDRTWSAAYEAGKPSEPDVPIEWVPEVHAALQESFLDWIHEPALFRRLADSRVPMHFAAAGLDIRPAWPLEQLAALLRHGSFEVLEQVPHDFWSTHPDTWVDLTSRWCAGGASAPSASAAATRGIRARPDP